MSEKNLNRAFKRLFYNLDGMTTEYNERNYGEAEKWMRLVVKSLNDDAFEECAVSEIYDNYIKKKLSPSFQGN